VTRAQILASYASNDARQRRKRQHRVAAELGYGLAPGIDPSKATPQYTAGRAWGQVPGARDAFRGKYHGRNDPARPPTLAIASMRARVAAHNADVVRRRAPRAGASS
jgi:hypothetical protein